MDVFERRSPIACSAAELFAYHARPRAFSRLTPPWDPVTVVTPLARLASGERAALRVRMGPVAQTVTALHLDVRDGSDGAAAGFVDTMENGPFSAYRHTHTFAPADGGTSVLVDHIDYALPRVPFAELFGGDYVRDRLAQLFAYRHFTTQQDVLLQQAPGIARAPCVVAVTGASGLIGTELCALLSVLGHEVRPVVRARSVPPQPGTIRTPAGHESSKHSSAVGRGIHFDAETGVLDAAAAAGVDVVIHLAGESVVGRLTAGHRARVLQSRGPFTRKLVAAFAALPTPPRVFVSASGVGFYGSAGDTVLDEDAPSGSGFLAEVCRAWEEAAQTAAAHGMRTAWARIGFVLSPAGGALAAMLPAFRAGVGGPLGGGTHYVPPVGIDDVAAILYRLAFDDRAVGAFNAVSPEPVTNAELTRVLGRVLDRPAMLPVPAAALRALFGELADEALLASTRVVPRKLRALGHTFRHTTLESALRHVLGRRVVEQTA